VVLLSLAFALVAIFGGLGYVVASAVSLWRQAKRTGRTLSAELAKFDERAARTERVLAEAERSSQALAEAQERLRVSRARLGVLTDEIERARRQTRWITAFLPTR
jgi:F0F1-type ATP synthase epsilon subunit